MIIFGSQFTHACRKGSWKLVEDIGEQNNLADEHPDIVKELLKEIKAHERDVEKNRSCAT